MSENDKKLLKVFFSIFIFLFSISILGFIVTGNITLVQLVEALFISSTFGFFFTGILAFRYNKKSAIIPTRKVLKWFAVITLPIATVVTLLVIFLLFTIQEIPNDTATLVVMPIIIFLMMFLIIFLMIIVFFIEAFGMVGVIAAFVRGYAPEILLHVSRISESRAATKLNKKKVTKMSTMDSIISWLFAIPDVLETKTLKINEGRPRNWFPWSNLYKAIWWQTLFGAVIIVYISFNPLYLKSELDFQNLFSIAANSTIAVPFFIMPWFIYLRLGAKIKGQIKDYELYRGIVYRMYQTFFTLGTIILILRIGLGRVSLEAILLALPAYYIFFMAIIFLLTFIYFNYFDNGLAWEVAKRYNQIKD
jgi:hypothetical protein